MQSSAMLQVFNIEREPNDNRADFEIILSSRACFGVTQAAMLLGVSTTTIYNWLDRGMLQEATGGLHSKASRKISSRSILDFLTPPKSGEDNASEAA